MEDCFVTRNDVKKKRMKDYFVPRNDNKKVRLDNEIHG